MNGLFQVAGSLFPEFVRLQQLLDEVSPAGSSGIRALAGRSFPAVNVGSTSDAVEVIAFVPGIDPKEIEITVDRGLLSLAGQRTSESQTGQEGAHTYAKERFTGQFRRVISLPEDADPAKVEAKFRDGILHIKVAKRESSKPRQITIS
ncbi:MAG: Hsp20/alpha crystallin family protein [Caldimonas sp.]